MLTKKLTLLLTCLLAFHTSTSTPAHAQDSLLLRDYQTVRQQDAWLTSPNAAALTRFTAPNIAEAELSMTKGDGGLVDYYQSDNTLQASASVESFFRLSPRTVVFGAISYDNHTGHNMTGSVFIDPTRNPFDIVEDSLANPGRKHRDTYHLTGGVGIDVWQGYALGLSLDYTAANYAKYKDLRHKNKLMDMTLCVGAYAPVLPWLSAGTSYQYHRSTESVSFGTYGKSEKVYKSLIDYGAFMGLVEQFGNDGYTDKSHEMPLFEDSHGGSFQLELCPTGQWSVYGSFAFSRGDGYYGRKSPYTITYTEHRRHTYSDQLTITYHPLSRTSRHRLNFAYQNEKLANHAETYRELTNETSATYYEYYDPVETADKQWDDVTLDYTAQLGINSELPTWELQAVWHWADRKQAAYLFPYYRHQQLTVNDITLQATRNLIGRQGVWSFSLEAGFQKGNGQPYEDHTFTTPSAVQEPPATMEAFLYREYQYLTAAQYHLGGNVKYAFLFPGTRLKTHARIALNYRRANEVSDYSTGRQHTLATLAIGCTF